MSEENALVIVAGYRDLDSARRDFETLTDRTKAKHISLRGAVLVGKDPEGNPLLLDTGNRLGRRGAKWGAGVGLAVGLFSPALLATAAVGAAAGALAGTFANHRIKSGLADNIGQAMSAGSAVIIAVTPAQGRLPVGQALAGSPMKSVAELSRSTLRSLGAALQDAMGKFNPDRTRLPLPQRSFGGTIGRTMAESVGDWSIVPGPFLPDDAPNVLIVLIDDAGFGGPDTFGGAIRTPTLTRVAQNGLAYNRFHVTAVCSPTRAALLTGRNHHRVGFGSVCEFPGPFPGYSTVKPNSCAALPRILRDNGYVTGAFGKWHLTPDNVQGAAGPFDNWPLGWGFDHFWGFPSGAAGQYDPIITQDNTVTGVPQEKDGKTYYFPDDLTDKAVEWLHTVRAQDATKPWMLYYSTGATHAPHHVFKEWADKYRGQFDEGWDVYRQETFERQKHAVLFDELELTVRAEKQAIQKRHLIERTGDGAFHAGAVVAPDVEDQRVVGLAKIRDRVEQRPTFQSAFSENPANTSICSTEPIPTGDVTVRMQFETEAPVVGSGGRVTLWADDRLIGEGELPQTVSLAFTSYAAMDIGRDNGLVVDRGYQDKAPYAFTGTVKEVVFDLKPVHLEAEKALHEHASVQAVGQGAAG